MNIKQRFQVGPGPLISPVRQGPYDFNPALDPVRRRWWSGLCRTCRQGNDECRRSASASDTRSTAPTCRTRTLLQLPTTLHDHRVTTEWPPTDRWLTINWPPTDQRLTIDWPSTDRRLTAKWPALIHTSLHASPRVRRTCPQVRRWSDRTTIRLQFERVATIRRPASRPYAYPYVRAAALWPK